MTRKRQLVHKGRERPIFIFPFSNLELKIYNTLAVSYTHLPVKVFDNDDTVEVPDLLLLAFI